MTNTVIAKVKGKFENSIVQFTTNEPLFNESGSNVKSASPQRANFNYKLWSRKLHDLSREAFFPEFLRSGKLAGHFNEVREEQFQSICWIGEPHVDAIYFQRVLPSQKTAIEDVGFRQVILQESTYKILKINSTPDAVYQFSADTLFYRDFSVLESIFPGVHTIIDDSPDPFMGTFLNSSLLFNVNRLSHFDFSTENRKKMTVLQNLTFPLSKKEKTSLVYYLTETNPNFIATPSYGEVVVRDDKDLTQIVEALDEALFAAKSCEQHRRRIFDRTPGFLD